MKIGVPKEVKIREARVGLTPSCVDQLVRDGHEILVQKGLGIGIGFSDEVYVAAGAHVVETAEELYASSEMVVKVKEPIEQEYGYLRPGLILFCYFHLAAEPQLTKALVDSGAVAIAYETVVGARGGLPLLLPMSEIAGRLSIQMGAESLLQPYGGKGVLLGGVPGVLPARVVVLGGGVAGTEAARMASGLGADVIILDNNLRRLKELEERHAPHIKTFFSTPNNVARAVKSADLLIGSVLIPGARAPKLVTREILKTMEPGSVFVDISIDQGGTSETSRPTNHDNPTYVEEGVLHYCVTNMPGACARTSSEALTNATLRYTRSIAKLGWKKALLEDNGLRLGLNVCDGKVTNEAVAEALGYEFQAPDQVI